MSAVFGTHRLSVTESLPHGQAKSQLPTSDRKDGWMHDTGCADVRSGQLPLSGPFTRESLKASNFSEVKLKNENV